MTPLDADGHVDEESVDRLIASIRDDVTGLMPALSSGEGWKLSVEQWRDMVSYTRRHSGTLPVLAGVQLPDTDGVVERSRLARELGADAVVVSTPFRAEITQQEIYRHYRTLRDAVDIPIFVYNEAAVSGNETELATLLDIFRLPGVVGVKESSGSPEMTAKIAQADHSVPVFEGWESQLLSARGIAGFIGPLANLEPVLCNAMLVDPTPDGQREIDAACERHGLFKDDWYRWAKQELKQRGILRTDLVTDDLSA